MGKIANRQSLVILDRGLKSQPFSQFGCIGVFKTNRQSRVSNRNLKSQGRQRFQSRVFKSSRGSLIGSHEGCETSKCLRGKIWLPTVVEAKLDSRLPSPKLRLLVRNASQIGLLPHKGGHFFPKFEDNAPVVRALETQLIERQKLGLPPP